MSACHAGALGLACLCCNTCTGAAHQHPSCQRGKAGALQRSKFWWLITCIAKIYALFLI